MHECIDGGKTGAYVPRFANAEHCVNRLEPEHLNSVRGHTEYHRCVYVSRGAMRV